MQNTPLLPHLQRILQNHLHTEGFQHLPNWNQFRKSTPTGFICLIYALKSYSDVALLELHAGIRIDAVEQMVFPFLNFPSNFQCHSMTLITNFSNIVDVPMRTEIENEEALDDHLLIQLQHLDRAVHPFLRSHQQIDQIADLFNAHPEKRLKLNNNVVHRCFRGLALAFLVRPEQVVPLGQAYQGVLEQWGVAEAIQERFGRFIEELIKMDQ